MTTPSNQSRPAPSAKGAKGAKGAQSAKGNSGPRGWHGKQGSHASASHATHAANPDSASNANAGPSLALQLRHAAACVLAVSQGQSLGVPLAAVPPELRPGVQALAFHALRHWGCTQSLVQALASRKPEPLVQALLCTALCLLLTPHPLDTAPDPATDPGAQTGIGTAPDNATPPNTGPSSDQPNGPKGRKQSPTPDPTPDTTLGSNHANTFGPVDGPTAGGQPLYRAHTVVDQCIQAAKQHPRSQRQAPFINACLRRFLRERGALLAAAQATPQGRWNHPAWWVDTLRRDHPGHWRGLLKMAQQAGPMTLRVNARHHSPAAYQALLAEAGLVAHPIGADGLVLAHAVPVTQLPGFDRGWVSVQDAAAQRAAPLILAALGWEAAVAQAGLTKPPPAAAALPRVLDACAAPGGKSAHLLERADLDLWALDVDAQRCQRTEQTLQRLGLHAEVRCADAADTAAWWDGRPFDAILLDAPCSGSGIVRRHPDARWLRRASDLGALVRTQQRLLEALWPLLRPGGRLVYATCSVFRAEGSAQLTRFLAAHPDARALPGLGYLLPPADAAAAEQAAAQASDHAPTDAPALAATDSPDQVAADPGVNHVSESPAALRDNAACEYDGFFYAALDKAS